jgi:hypothetical protein
MSDDATNGESGRNRPYVVLEQQDLGDVVGRALETARVELSDATREAISELGGDVYVEKGRVPSRNAAHALRQIGGKYGIGVTPPLIAISERQFRARQVKVDAGDPRVSLS